MFFFAISLQFRSLSTKYLVSLVSFSLFFQPFFITNSFSPYFLFSLFLIFLVNKNSPCSNFFPCLIFLILNLMFLVSFSPYFDCFHVSSPCVYPPDVHSLCPPSSCLLFFLLGIFSKKKKMSLPFFCKIFVFLFQSPFSILFFHLFSETSLVFLLLLVPSFFFFWPLSILLFRKKNFSPNKISFSNVTKIVFS